MKKVLGRLLILTLGLTVLSGCDLFSLGGETNTTTKGDEDHEVKGLVLKDYSTSVFQNSKYEFDGKVYLSYEDSSIADYEVTSDCSFSEVDTSTIGQSELKVSYEGSKYIYSKKVYIDVKEYVTLKDLVVENYTSSIKRGNTYTFNGTVTAKYSNNTSKDVTKLAKISTLDTSSAGQKPLDISYTEDGITKTKTVEIKVYEARAKLSKIVATGYTTEVEKNGTYNFDGVVTATFADNTTEVVTGDCEFDYDKSFSTSSVGTKSLKIKYTTNYTNTSGQEVENYKTTTASVTVISILTGISCEDLVVGLNKSKTISPTFIPSDATYKGVTYESSDPSTASVDANGTITAYVLGSVTITATSTKYSNISTTFNVTVENVVQDEWTILLYIAGNNLESDSYQGGAATEDLQEIASVSGQPDDINVVVQAGGANSWKSTYSSVINKDKRNRFHLNNKTYVKDSQDNKVNMGDEKNFREFLEWGINTYPADKIGVVLWNHGGAMSGCCGDEQFGDDYLTIEEANNAFRDAKINTGYASKFEFIGYDCCLMQVQDIAGINAQYAKYQIASQESEWGYGWSYDKWIDDLFAKKTTPEILKACVDGFKQDTTSAYGSGSGNDQTLSYVNLQYWDAYETAWENMATTLNGIITSSSTWSTLKSLLNSCQRFGGTQYGSTMYYMFDVFDVGHFLTKMQASSSPYKSNTTLMSQANAVQTAYYNLIGYEWHGGGSSNATGLSLFAPVSGYSSTSDYTTGSTPFTAWRNLCLKVWNWSY